MRTSLPLFALLGLLWATPALAGPDYTRHVVQLHVTYQLHDEYQPWAKTKPRQRKAHAVLVRDGVLVTEAEMVENATLIQVEKHGEPRKVPARVLHLDRHVNLALLTVDDPGFFDDLEPAPLADAVPQNREYRIVRWKEGQLEEAGSRFSRMEVFNLRTYGAQVALLVVNTDLDAGGAVEPVFHRRDLVGITEWAKEDRAHVIPAGMIQTYLDAALDDDGYPGFGHLGLFWQENRDPGLAAHLGLSGDPRGVIIRQVHQGGSAHGTLMPLDVLLALDGHPIDADGYYDHPRYGRLKYPHILIDGHLAGDTLPVTVLRDGQVLDLHLTLVPYPADAPLVPWRAPDTPPPYLVAGGLVFRTLDLDYLQAWKDWTKKAPRRLVTYWDLQRHAQTPDQRRIVLLTYVLPDPYNIGYHDVNNVAVASVNGRPVDSIDDVAAAFDEPLDGYHVIEMMPNGTRHEIVLDAGTFEEASERILGSYGIPAGERLE